MRIIFLCGSLEPGRDGVGDYIRRLASELIRQGNQAEAVALNDQHLFDEFSGIQKSEGTELYVLRLPSLWSEKQRFNRAKKWIDVFNPDWISLQFVPFSFHPKGLPFGLSSLLNYLGNGRSWHIMFHELWLGMELGSSFKNLLLGLIQKKIIKNLVSELKPNIIHTQTQVYQAQLYKIGILSSYLPLFTNIPQITREGNMAKDLLTKTKKQLSLVIFGFINSGCPVREFVKEVALYAKEKNIDTQLTFIGRCGNEKDNWVSACKSERVPVKLLGEQTVQQISKVLEDATVGISTTPTALAEKSGTIAAMREHGLPIICVSKPWQARGVEGIKILSGIYEYQKGNLKYLLEQEPKYITNFKVSEVSKLLLESLAIN